MCHFPPGTSKWNKVEHRLFSFISSNWRGEPLRDYETVVKLIARTTTSTGLKVVCRLDRRNYAPGRTVSDADMETICLERNQFHGDWNYVITPPRGVVDIVISLRLLNSCLLRKYAQPTETAGEPEIERAIGSRSGG